ncbi:MAG: FHA domain-containing protein [bacterium]|nr:FHA domain-containing protein [bacterium]
MSELAMTVLRLSYLLLLWIFVWAAISVLRQDLYSVTRVTPRGRGRAQQPAKRSRRGRGRDARQASPAAGATPGSSAPRPIGPTSSAPGLPPRTPERTQGRPPSRLRMTAGKLAGTSVPLGKSAIVVGRAQSCSLVLDDEYASSRHARFFPTGDAWFVEDMGSTNGTFVNGQRITEPTQIGLGHVVQIGQSSMELTR